MKWSYAGVAAIVAGLIGFSILLLFQNLTTKNEEEYYNLKEVCEASMIDAIDIAYYRDTGQIKMIEQKFVENFIRRFSNVASFNASGYKIEFYDIMEIPPKVSVVIKTLTGQVNVGGSAEEFEIANQLDAILETKYKYEGGEVNE